MYSRVPVRDASKRDFCKKKITKFKRLSYWNSTVESDSTEKVECDQGPIFDPTLFNIKIENGKNPFVKGYQRKRRQCLNETPDLHCRHGAEENTITGSEWKTKCEIKCKYYVKIRTMGGALRSAPTNDIVYFKIQAWYK